MALAIRLSRGGRKKRPFYRIVVADKRMPRDGRYIERLGTYNPLLEQDNDNRVTLVKDRIEYWLGQGAKPSERVAKFLGQAGIIDMPETPNRPNKAAPSEKTKMKLMRTLQLKKHLRKKLKRLLPRKHLRKLLRKNKKLQKKPQQKVLKKKKNLLKNNISFNHIPSLSLKEGVLRLYQ